MNEPFIERTRRLISFIPGLIMNDIPGRTSDKSPVRVVTCTDFAPFTEDPVIVPDHNVAGRYTVIFGLNDCGSDLRFVSSEIENASMLILTHV
jgi:hypothetical protein